MEIGYYTNRTIRDIYTYHRYPALLLTKVIGVKLPIKDESGNSIFNGFQTLLRRTYQTVFKAKSNP